MFTLTNNPTHGTLSVRPVDKATDRSVVREIFRREFYGDCRMQYPDEELWQIYDRMETNDVFGAYLVSQSDHVLFLLEIHPPVQMDVMGEYLSQPGTIGIYCFYHCLQESVTLPAIRACIASLLAHPDVSRILTTLSHVPPGDTRAILLNKCGFDQLPEGLDGSAVYCCTRESFDHSGAPGRTRQLQEY